MAFLTLAGVLLALGVLARPVSSQVASTATPQIVLPVSTVTPNSDGSITHVVQYGETLIDIANAYGISLQELYDHNRALNPQAPSYFEGQVLIIRSPYTETPYLSPTATQRPPTRTPLPTRTPRPTRTATLEIVPTATRIPTATPFLVMPTLDDLPNRGALGVGLIAVCAVGLVAVIAFGFWPRKQ